MTIARRILAIMLALQVTSAWALPAGVLCVADDGHLALKDEATESSHQGGHSHGTEHSHHAVESHAEARSHAHDHAHSSWSSAADEHHCHPCVDVALVDEPPVQKTGNDDAAAPPSLTAVHPAVGSTISNSPWSTRVVVEPPSPPPALRALRTVVLTC